jgi:arylsulfatase A-like enzyme
MARINSPGGGLFITGFQCAIALLSFSRPCLASPMQQVDSSLSSVEHFSGASVLADGLRTAEITVTVSDTNGTPLPGAIVTITSDGDGNTIIQSALATDLNGVAIATIASTVPEVKTISATAGNAMGTVDVIDTAIVTFDPPPHPNLVIIMIDDLGIDVMRSYHSENPHMDSNGVLLQESVAESMDFYPQTPNIDALVSDGVTFRNVYGAPLCSPARAMMMTGELVHRNGMGTNPERDDIVGTLAELGVGPGNARMMLPEQIQLWNEPSVQDGYLVGHVGKHHLFIPGAIAALPGFNAGNGVGMGSDWDWIPNVGHWEWWRSTYHNLGNLVVPDYGGSYPDNTGYYYYRPLRYDLTTIEDNLLGGTYGPSFPIGYATTVQVEDALTFMGDADMQSRPFVLLLALNAPHKPFEFPPLGLQSNTYTAYPQDVWPNYCAMVEAVDSEIGRLRTEMASTYPGILEKTTFVLIGDNGIPGPVIGDLNSAGHPFPGADYVALTGPGEKRFKNSAYERGLRIPLIVSGGLGTQVAGSMRGSIVDPLVSIVDMYAFVADFIGVEIPMGTARDSVSFAPLLRGGQQSSPRQEMLSGIFSRQGVYPPIDTSDFHEEWGFTAFLSDSEVDPAGLDIAEAGRYKLVRNHSDPAQAVQGTLSVLGDELYLLDGTVPDPNELNPLDISGPHFDAYMVMTTRLDSILFGPPTNITNYCLCEANPNCTTPNPYPFGGCKNSTNVGAELVCRGGATSVAADDLLLTVIGAIPGESGLIYLGQSALLGQPSFGDGQRCVGAPNHRFSIRMADSAGEFTEGPGIVADTVMANDVPITAGSTYFFQGWYRDPQGDCGTSFNLTQGLAVTFGP